MLNNKFTFFLNANLLFLTMKNQPKSDSLCNDREQSKSGTAY